MNQFRSSRCKNAACNKIPSCGSRVLNTFVFLRQRCTWPAPVIPQVFGTSVSDKSPAPGRLPALFSLRQSFRATSTEPPPRFVDSFLRPHFHPRFFLFLLLPFLFLFFPFLLSPSLSFSLSLCTLYIPRINASIRGFRIRKRFVVPKYLRIVLRCNVNDDHRRIGKDREKFRRDMENAVSVEGHDTTGYRILAVRLWYPTTTYRQRNARNRPMTDRRWPMGTAHKTYYPPFTARW